MHLTPRELDIIAAVLNGYTANKEIAQLLEIRKRTVEKHLERIKQKTGVRKVGLPYWVKQNLGGEHVGQD